MGVEREAGALLIAGANGSSVARELSGYAADEGRGRNGAGSGCGAPSRRRRWQPEGPARLGWTDDALARSRAVVEGALAIDREAGSSDEQ